MAEQVFEDAQAPTITIADDGRAALRFSTAAGPILLFMTADVPELLQERIASARTQTGRIPSRVRFEGEPPFHLPVAQRAIARAVTDAVEMTLHAIVPDHGPAPVLIRTMMTWHVAQTLAREMTGAALQAESNAGAD
jgi:hypothetical protein